jgi:hypothetical protein
LQKENAELKKVLAKKDQDYGVFLSIIQRVLSLISW